MCEWAGSSYAPLPSSPSPKGIHVGVHLRPHLRGRIVKSMGFEPSQTLKRQASLQQGVQPNSGKRPHADFASKSRNLSHNLQRRIRAAVTTCRTRLCNEQNNRACPAEATPLPSAAHTPTVQPCHTHRSCPNRDRQRDVSKFSDLYGQDGGQPPSTMVHSIEFGHLAVTRRRF